MSIADDCPFCLSENGSARGGLLSNTLCYVRPDEYPAVPGHVLIIPKRHVVSLAELSVGEVLDTFELYRWLTLDYYRGFDFDGFTVGVNDGPASGRTVEHCHLHVIPRRHGDVPDPRGGVRRVVCPPEKWLAEVSS